MQSAHKKFVTMPTFINHTHQFRTVTQVLLVTIDELASDYKAWPTIFVSK